MEAPTALKRRRDTRVKDAFLFDAVDEYFDKQEDSWAQMVSVLKQKGKKGGVSLRLLDFLCTVYSYQHQCTVRVADGSMVPLLEVYETSLDAYGKSHYDCFRRTARLTIEKHGQRLQTTLGQLLFFRDIIRNGVLDFAREHAEDIKVAMTEQQKPRKRRKTHMMCPQQMASNVGVPLFSR